VTPFVPFPGGAQAEIGYRLGGKTMENRLWFRKDDLTISLTDLQGLADGLALWHLNKVTPHLSADIQVLSVIAVKWDDHEGDLFAQSILDVPGGTLEASYSANVAVRVNLRWPLSFRERKNANFIPGIPDSGLEGNVVQLSWATSVWNAYADLIDDARVFSPVFQWRWMVASAYDDGELRAEQRVGECIGPVRPGFFTLAQRRKRLPVPS